MVKYSTTYWVDYDCRFFNIDQIPVEASITRATLIKEICSIKGVWVERFAEKMDHHLGSEKVIVDTVNQMMNKKKIDSQYFFTSFTSLTAQGVLSFLIARKRSSQNLRK